MTKEGYQPKRTTEKPIPPNTGSNVHMKKDGYTWEDLDRSYWEGFDNAKNKMEKRIAELEQQIEKMKCCGNCSHFKLDNNGLYPIKVCEFTYPNKCKNHKKKGDKRMTDEWTRAEKRKAQSEQAKAIMDFVSMLSDKIADLEKENAELKEKLNFCTQYYQGEKAKDQLTKAKYLLKQLVNAFPKSYSDVVKDTLNEARKFVEE